MLSSYPLFVHACALTRCFVLEQQGSVDAPTEVPTIDSQFVTIKEGVACAAAARVEVQGADSVELCANRVSLQTACNDLFEFRAEDNLCRCLEEGAECDEEEDQFAIRYQLVAFTA